MKKVSVVVGKAHQKNALFNLSQSRLIGSFGKYHKLKETFESLGYEVGTQDICPPESADLVLYMDMPKKLPRPGDTQKSFLIAIESSIIRPENLDRNKHNAFNKVFTWNDDLVDGKKYLKLNYAFALPNEIQKKVKRPRLCCLIASNKSSSASNELYTERIELVRWFEKAHPNHFSLYGIGWNEYKFRGPLVWRALNLFPVFKKCAYLWFGEKFPSYRGAVSEKTAVMADYRFVIAYENVKGEQGYITEKIFDAFMAGCVPIYLGASNVTDYIPPDCFIDRRSYASFDELHNHLISMSDDEYLTFLNNIESYLRSDRAKQFSEECFAQTIVNGCLNALE